MKIKIFYCLISVARLFNFHWFLSYPDKVTLFENSSVCLLLCGFELFPLALDGNKLVTDLCRKQFVEGALQIWLLRALWNGWQLSETRVRSMFWEIRPADLPEIDLVSFNVLFARHPEPQLNNKLDWWNVNCLSFPSTVVFYDNCFSNSEHAIYPLFLSVHIL
jgi:hypothetical protein